MDTSRTRNAARNSSVALVCQILVILLGFINKTVLIYTLGREYNGVSSFFSNILTVLSFAELGIGNAIIFSMYKPVALGDRDKVKSLMALYGKAYRVIGCVVAAVGLLIIPLLGFFEDPPNIKESLTLIYLLYLTSTVSSYFFVYKKSIILANQKNYVASLYHLVFTAIQHIAQIAVLLLTGNFILFLAVQIACVFLNNVFTSRKADRMYPYLKEGKALPLPKEESRGIFRNVRALVAYKLGSVILNGTDNILITALDGFSTVGVCNNYIMVITYLRTLIGGGLEAFTSSVGNLNAIEDAQKKESVFNKLLLISSWLYGFLSVGLLLLFQDFIVLWLDETYLLPFIVVFALVLHVYVDGVHFAAYTYRTTLGYFVQGRIAPLAAAALNIALSILMYRWIGLSGIFFATSISRFVTIGLVDPILIYRKAFKKNPIIYYLKYFAYALLVSGLYFLLRPLMPLIPLGGLAGFVVRIVVITVLFNLAMLLVFFRTKVFRELLDMAKGLLKRTGKGR